MRSLKVLSNTMKYADAKGSLVKFEKIRFHRKHLKMLKTKIIKLAYVLKFYKEYVYLPLVDDVSMHNLNFLDTVDKKEIKKVYYDARLGQL
jgi:hypothetical protein